MIDMMDYANRLLHGMAAAQIAQPENDMSDQQAAHQLNVERLERVTAAIYNAAMLGLPEDDVRVICAEVGITYDDLRRYTPPVLRQHSTKEEELDTAPF